MQDTVCGWTAQVNRRPAVAVAGLTVVWLCVCGALQAAPCRVLVPPPRGAMSHTELRDRAACVEQCLALYLYEWLESERDVWLVDESRAASVAGFAYGAAWVRPPAEVFSAVQSLVKVDALVRSDWLDGTLTVRLYTADHVRSQEIPWRDTAGTPAALQAAAAWLAGELKLERSALPFGGKLTAADATFVEDYFLARRFRAEWLSNSGEAQLEMLRPHLNRLPDDVWAAAAIVRAGQMLSMDNRAVTKPAPLVLMVEQALPSLLGTDFEPIARQFCQVNRHRPETISKALLDMVARAGQDAVDAALEDGAAGKIGGLGDDAGGDLAAGGVFATLGGVRTSRQQAGALRCLGVLKPAAALPSLTRAAQSEDAVVRQAAAWALSHYAAPAGEEELEALRADPDAQVAFFAAWAEWRRGSTPPDLAARAAACLAEAPDCEEALQVLAVHGSPVEVPALVAARNQPRAALRAHGVGGLLRLGALDADGVRLALDDPHTLLLRVALAGLPVDALPAHRERLITLANQPEDSLAETARLRLATLAPVEPRARRQFELAVEHTYVRRQLVNALAREGTAEALDDLAEAVHNADAHTRALALRRLTEVSPARAQAAVGQLLADPHRLVRLQAAATAALVATANERTAIESALAENPDAAARLYLADALARSLGQPVPASRPAVNRVSATHNQTFNCGLPANGARTPFDGFYGLHLPPVDQVQAMRDAQAAGKIILLRANRTAKNPAQVFLNSGWRDGFWLGLDDEFDGLWENMDGVVLGEESMYFRPYNEWDRGWRLFCREAGIDAARVAGERDKLTEVEKRAWWDWEQRVAIEGFNAMVDYIRLHYGKLRPGFQVATFMPDQNGPCAYDRLWDFDIAAAYYYAAPSRTRYATIRRLKTTWPDRPVLWLNQGKVGVGLGLNLTSIQHSTQVPDSPLHSIRDISGADSICTWLAGGHTGLFATYLFVHVGWKGEDFGVWVGLEDLVPDGAVFAKGLEHSFRGLGKAYRLADEIKNAKPDSTLATAVELDLDDPDLQADPYAEREAHEKERFRQGFLLERKLIQDTVNLLAGVPFPAHPHTVLLVGPREMRAPGFDLVNAFDCLAQINQLGERDLGGYRMIGLRGQDQAALKEETITAISAWLRATPGLLYVHGWVCTDNDNRAVRADDLKAALTADWPWEAAITPVFGKSSTRGREVERLESYQVAPGEASILQEQDGKPTLVFWQGQGMKGGVLFDAGGLAATQLQPLLNGLVAKKRVGLAMTGPIGMQAITTPDLTVAASCGAAAGTWRLPGVDALSGVLAPELGAQRAGALFLRAARGKYLVATNDLVVLSERPLDQVEYAAGGVRIKGGGLLQVVSSTGAVEAQVAGAALPAVSEADLLSWMFVSDQPGVIALERTEPAGRATLVRADGWIDLRAREL